MRNLAKLTASSSILLAPMLVFGAPAQASTAPVVKVLATHLNAPKHLTIGPAGDLFAAESGDGGRASSDNCVTGPNSEGSGTTKFCEGASALVDRFSSSGSVKSYYAGLPSIIEEDSSEPFGPSAIAFNHGWAALTYQDDLVGKKGTNPFTGAAATTFGTMQLRHGKSVVVVHISSFAAAHPQNATNLGGEPHAETTYDSDPYDVAAYGSGFVVADAAANSLLSVTDTGKVTLLARFPTEAQTVPAKAMGNPKPETINAQAVPTSVAVGPEGALYVGLLRGIPSNPKGAQIYRVVPGHQPTVWANGLTAVTSIAFDGHKLLATEYNTDGLLGPASVPGALVEISSNGKTVTTLPVHGLFDPTGVAVSGDGTVYVSDYGNSLASAKSPGEILKITGLS